MIAPGEFRRSLTLGRELLSGSVLGCRPKEPAAEITYRFVKVVNESINADVQSPERRGRYKVAVLSMMQDNATDIRPKSFADQHLEPEDRARFLARLVDAGFNPEVSFAKDTSRVNVDEFKMRFTSGMVLAGPPRALQENVSIPDKPSRDRPVELHDTVENVLTGR